MAEMIFKCCWDVNTMGNNKRSVCRSDELSVCLECRSVLTCVAVCSFFCCVIRRIYSLLAVYIFVDIFIPVFIL